MDWTSPMMWTLTLAVVIPLLVQALKWLLPRLECSKLALRLAVVVTAAIGAAAAQLTTTGLPVDWWLWAQTTAAAVAGAEFTWQWIIKRLEGVSAWDVS